MTIRRGERDEYGVVVTAVSADGETHPLIGYGPVDEAMREIVAGLDGDWRIRTISSPNSIMRDLEGTRAAIDENSHVNSSVMRPPEAILLGRLKRMDLLEGRDPQTTGGQGNPSEGSAPAAS